MKWRILSSKHSVQPKPMVHGPQEQVAVGGALTERTSLDPGSLLDLLPVYVTVLDRQRRILQANHAFLADFGQERIGTFCYEAYKGRESVCPECQLNLTLSSGRNGSWEETIQTSLQGAIPTMVHTVPLADPRGFIYGAVKICSDISQARRSQRQAEISQQEYKALFHGVPCYISIQDPDYTIIRTNRFFEKEFGRGIGRRCYQAYKGRDSKCEACPVEKSFQDGEIHSSEETVRTASGETMDVIVYATPVRDLSGNVSAVMEMSTNITEVKRLQRELAALGQAVAITAHGVKNILGGLQGGAYVVQSGLKRGDQRLAERGWEMVKEGVELVGQLVKDILLISKARVPEYKETLPNDTAKQVWRLFEKRATDLGVELILEPEQGESQVISMDPTGIHTVLSNLVSNALDACAATGEKKEKRISVRVRDQGEDGVLYEVEDNGVGISDAVKDRILGEVVSTKGSKGTGLGLVVTRKIVAEHGGSISFRSRPQTGTVFTVRLPRAPKQGAGRWETISGVVTPTCGIAP